MGLLYVPSNPVAYCIVMELSLFTVPITSTTRLWENDRERLPNGVGETARRLNANRLVILKVKLIGVTITEEWSVAILPETVSTVPTIDTKLPIDRVRRDALIRVIGVSCAIRIEQ